MLSGNQPKPGSQVTSVLEVHPIANGSDHCGGRLGPNAFDSSDPLTGWGGLEHRVNLLVDNSHPAVQITHEIPQLGSRLPRHRCQLISRIGQQCWDDPTCSGDRLGEGKAAVEE